LNPQPGHDGIDRRHLEGSYLGTAGHLLAEYLVDHPVQVGSFHCLHTQGSSPALKTRAAADLLLSFALF
jgi:hypothetical protein